MSDLERLRKIVETNFRLNIMQTRELGLRVSQEMGSFSKEMGSFSKEMGSFSKEMDIFSEKLESISKGLDSVSKDVRHLGRKVEGLGQNVEGLGGKFDRLGSEFEHGLKANAARDQQTSDALRQILDNSVDLHKTVQDHEARLRKLEGLDEAS